MYSIVHSVYVESRVIFVGRLQNFSFFQHNVQQTQHKLKDSTNEWRELFDDCSGRLFTTENTQLNFHWSGNGKMETAKKHNIKKPKKLLHTLFINFVEWWKKLSN